MNGLTMPKGTIEIKVNGKWESVILSDTYGPGERKLIKELYGDVEGIRFGGEIIEEA